MDKIMLIPDSSDDEVWFSDPDISASATQSGERKTQTWAIAIESNNAEHYMNKQRDVYKRRNCANVKYFHGFILFPSKLSF